MQIDVFVGRKISFPFTLRQVVFTEPSTPLIRTEVVIKET